MRNDLITEVEDLRKEAIKMQSFLSEFDSNLAKIERHLYKFDDLIDLHLSRTSENFRFMDNIVLSKIEKGNLFVSNKELFSYFIINTDILKYMKNATAMGHSLSRLGFLRGRENNARGWYVKFKNTTL